MRITKLLFTFILALLVNFVSYAQGLLDKLDKEYPKNPTYEMATFKTTRLGLGHSVETRKKGTLEISWYNRYWNRPNGETQFFLADEVNMRFGLDYAISDNFAIGVGYSTWDEIADGYLKYKFLRQTKKGNPFSMVALQTISMTDNMMSRSLYGANSSSNNYSFTSKILIARKFNPKLSLQVSPFLILRSQEPMNNNPGAQYGVGFGGRYKVGGHVSIVSEYYAVFNPIKTIKTYNPFMVGVNWELSHLMLQFHMTNARTFAEDAFITQTTNNFNFHDGNFHFGFNATFVLQLSKNKL
ncbi:DUF5777 family beta-barrel protein [Tenacibaculum jejuense]|uniref:DUF5777 domain-containing protein n=1 Tax=Tenacibaculum jejuense TaxID=584609 RepID=A0A238U4K3_9FLAO|nr:DUF5777 family beta-barrel protein [Tenacibaculum jejuense]SNR14067.1 conserved protein of unknown function [Tenacibaculum jejuense]